MPATPNPSIIALDVGDKRVGVAIASLAARLPRPLTTLERSGGWLDELAQIVQSEDVGTIVVGLPRGLDGQSTAQTETTQQIAEQLKQFGVPVHLQDEALTSQKAESELQTRGGCYQRSDIDALAATYILEDFLAAQPKEVA